MIRESKNHSRKSNDISEIRRRKYEKWNVKKIKETTKKNERTSEVKKTKREKSNRRNQRNVWNHNSEKKSHLFYRRYVLLESCIMSCPGYPYRDHIVNLWISCRRMSYENDRVDDVRASQDRPNTVVKQCSRSKNPRKNKRISRISSSNVDSLYDWKHAPLVIFCVYYVNVDVSFTDDSDDASSSSWNLWTSFSGVRDDVSNSSLSIVEFSPLESSVSSTGVDNVVTSPVV